MQRNVVVGKEHTICYVIMLNTQHIYQTKITTQEEGGGRKG